MRAFFGCLVVAMLVTSPAHAQSSESTWNDLPDRFQIDTGYFRIDADTTLRYNGPDGGSNVNFEQDLGVNPHVNTFWLDATWRVGRRHQLKVGYTRFNRERPDHMLTRNFQWGDQVYNAGLSADATTGSDILGGYYRFALFRNNRFEIGPTVGFGWLWLRAGIDATATVTGPGGTPVSQNLDRGTSTGSVTGAVGGYAAAWPASRLALRGDYLYIKVSPGNTTASITDWRAGADVYVFRNAGMGAQYKYYKYSYDRGIVSTKLGGDVTYKGFQVFLSFLF
jgi:hypothetical protein